MTPVALTGSEWIALAGVASGVLIGIASLVFAYLNGRAERKHAAGLARATRLHDQRLETYTDLATYLERARLYIERTEPPIDGAGLPEPPPALTDDEWIAMRGRATIAASANTQAAFATVEAVVTQFGIATVVYRGMPEDALQRPAAMQRLETVRGKAREAIDEAQTAMRDELESL